MNQETYCTLRTKQTPNLTLRISRPLQTHSGQIKNIKNIRQTSIKKPSFAKITEGIISNQMAKKATAPYKTSSYQFFPKPYSEQHAAMLISPNGRTSTGENGTALMTPIPSTLETDTLNNDYLCQIIVLLNQITQFIQPLLKDPNILKLINPPNIPTNIQNAENSSTRITQDSTNK